MTDKNRAFEHHDPMRGESFAARKHRPSSDRAGERSETAGFQQTVGNLAVQRLLHNAEGQPHIDVSRPGDSWEREADRLAAQAVASESADPGHAASENLSSGNRALPSSSSLISDTLGSSGLPLNEADRAPMEEFFDTDLSAVRIHTGEAADASARALNALAYSVGNEIVFRDGQPSRGTAAGKKLLAHELAHVARDSGKPTLYRDKDPAAAETTLPPGSVGVPEAEDVEVVDDKYPWQYPNVRTAIYQHREQALTDFLRINAKIEMDKGLMPVKDVTASEIQAERDRVLKEKNETNEAIKKDMDNEVLKMKWVRLDEDLKYLARLPKGKLPTNPAALEEVKKKWSAYIYGKKDDTGKDLEHDELLARVLDRFDADPAFIRYPKWLRYMVLHFSGLRYAGAHGSYAPAINLVNRLKAEEIKQTIAGSTEKEIDQMVADAETELEAESKLKLPRKRAAEVKSRLADLGGVETTIEKQFSKKGDENKSKAFEELMELEAMRDKVRAAGDVASEEEIDEKIAELTKTIGGARLASAKRDVAEARKRRQKALVVHEIERAQKELSTLDDAQVLAILRKMRTEGAFPDWFWLEVVRATPLRHQEEGTEWTKKMTSSERAGIKKAGPVSRQWLAILDEWKKDATAWRPRHGKDLSLIVSRAVCNEVAEQAQHARGVEPAGGIGQKASWYQKGVTEGRTFQQPTTANVQRGSSLFWAKWSDSAPTDNVHKVRSDLFPTLRTDDGQPISEGATDSNGHVYHVAGDDLVTRTEPIETRIDPDTPAATKTQWLVWVHEATVVDVVGDRVLTFETGPIGFHDHRKLSEVTTNVNIYIGFAPEGPEPKDVDKYLKDILPGR